MGSCIGVDYGENKNFVLKAYSTQKGSGGNFESGKHVSNRRFDHATWNTDD